ncbi:MAG: hypothetical protein DGJ47_000696 [Rickettsiaceae bacterium]
MRPNANPTKKSELYNLYLHEISGIKFTLREVDIISCILNNRGEKKVAAALSISNRTVGVHTYNIMGKLRCNSKENIIDFVEKSGKLQYFHQYYFQLIVQSYFEKQLQKISALINHDIMNCFVNFDNTDKEVSQLFNYLKNHLKLANIALIQNSKQRVDYTIHIISKEIVSNYKKITQNDIILLLDKDKQHDVSIYSSKNIVKLHNNAEYYFNVLSLIKKLFQQDKLEKIIQEFTTEYKNFQLFWQGTGKLVTINNVSYSRNYFYYIVALFIIVSVSLFLSMQNRTDPVVTINQECSDFMASFSFENIGITKGLKNNIDHLKQIDTVISKLDYSTLSDYSKNESISKEELLNYLYSLHAVAMNSLYNQYDKAKARKLLELAKDGIENYVHKQLNMEINFNELSPKELYLELSVIDNFPEIYTRILYLLGRTYTYFEEYNRSNQYLGPIPIKKVSRYYELSEYIGNKLSLFEGALSIRNGTEMIRLLNVKGDIQNGKKQKAAQETLKSIKVLEKLRQDKRQYISDYRPSNNTKIVVPGDDNYWKLFVTDQIINHYARLIKLDTNIQHQSRYLNKITAYSFGDKTMNGVFNELEDVPPKKIACLYNSLGHLLLHLVEQNISFKELANKIQNQLKIKSDNNLILTMELFNQASANSRKSYYPKADSYDGLIASYNLKLQRQKQTLTKQATDDLQRQINDLVVKRDEINKRLNRKSSQ